MKSDRIVVTDKTRFYLDGREVVEDVYRKRYPAPRDDRFELNGQTGDGKGWPIVSDALAVHPKRRQEAIDSALDKKVPTEFTMGGQPIFRDRQHRRAYCKAYGFFDRDGSYGDP